MEFQIKNLNRSINDIMRQIGYTPAYFQKDGEFSVVRKLSGNDYPRFHLYITERKKSNGSDKNQHFHTLEYESEGKFIFNLHLDQKKPSYGGSTKHSGEYEGPVVEGEAERIKQLLL